MSDNSRMKKIPSQPKPMMSVEPGPGLIGGKADRGAAPQKTGAAKATQRADESRRDAAMHSGDAYNSSGIEKAMGAHADKLHPC